MDTLDNLLDIFNFQLSDAHKNLLLDQMKIADFSLNDMIILEGEKSDYLYYIISGIVRGFYIDEMGNEYTKCFSTKHEFFSSEGLRTGKESSFSIDCLENCTCIKIPYSIIHKLSNEDIRIEKVIRALYTQEVARLENREKMLLLNSAEERYNHFRQVYPQLHAQIPLMYIASFIGVRSSSLSRIRRNQKIDS